MNIIANFRSSINKSCFLVEEHIMRENENLFYIRITLTNIFY